MNIYLTLAVALVGVLMYALSNNGKVQAIGFALFQCGALAFLICFCSHNVSFLK